MLDCRSEFSTGNAEIDDFVGKTLLFLFVLLEPLRVSERVGLNITNIEPRRKRDTTESDDCREKVAGKLLLKGAKEMTHGRKT